MSSFIDSRVGAASFASSSMTGPGFARSQSRHWRTIRFDCRISSTRTR